MDLDDRLRALERQNLTLRRATALAILLSLAAIGWRALPDAHAAIGKSVLEAEQLILRDAKGRTRLVLDVDNLGPGIQFWEGDGRSHAILRVTSGQVGKTLIEEGGINHSPGLYLYDRKGQLTWHAP